MPTTLKPLYSLILTLLALTALTGCGSHASFTITSPLSGASLSPKLTTRAYTFADENTVDIYLSDLTPEELGLPIDPDPAKRPVGQIVHIHMFIRPSPGKTPIEPQASNCSIRSASSGTFGGSISAGTLRLQAASPHFHDAIGPSGVRASFKVKENRELALTMARRLEEATPRDE